MVSELSILIPIYNLKIDPLVTALLAQCQQANIIFEIICLDDASDANFQENNRFLKKLKDVVYEELPHNISRAAIRNKLAQRARFSYLLFLDNDSEVITQDFILKYVQAGQPDTILIGGTLYQNNLPAPPYRLHWKFGRSREQKPADIRSKHPYRSMQVNNALVPQAISRQFPFDEKITQYGHEDSQWGRQLEQANIPVIHIYNPVRHAGLEHYELFLIKSKLAIQNLHRLYFIEGVGKDTSLIKSYLWLTQWRLNKLFFKFFKIIEPFLRLNLRSPWPSLFFLDLYKLGLFIQLDYTRKNMPPHE